MADLKVTHLHEYHVEHAKMTEFAGFDMPIWFEGITTEHMAVRSGVGIFDVTHMGRTVVTGREAMAFLNYITSNDVSKLDVLAAHYSTILNERGGIVDDFVLSRQGPERFMMVYNASNREKNLNWILDHSKNFDVKVEHISDEVAMFAVQGPKAEETLQKISSEDLSAVGRFKCCWTELAGCKAFISRTGYTAEDGFEVFILDTPLEKPDKAVKVWNAILEAGREFGIKPCGLGARDTLRLEGGMCLYGNDIDENTTPLEARLSWVVKFDKGDFIGKEALLKQREEGVRRRRSGIIVVDKGIPRPHQEVWAEGEKIGELTSGTYSPLLKRGIAMGYLKRPYSKAGTEVEVKIRERMVKAKVIKFPFYRRDSPETVVFLGEKIPCKVGEWEKLKIQ